MLVAVGGADLGFGVGRLALQNTNKNNFLTFMFAKICLFLSKI